MRIDSLVRTCQGRQWIKNGYVLATAITPETNTTMKTKSSNANLYLYTFLSLLMGLVSLVDPASLGQRAMDHQKERAEQAVKAWGL